MLEGLFDKVAGPQACNFIKKRLQQRCFQVKLERTPILKNICDRLFLSDDLTNDTNENQPSSSKQLYIVTLL